MRLRLQGVVGTGVGLLDDGIKDIAVHATANGVFVYSTTGRIGGVTGYSINGTGTVSVHCTMIFPPGIAEQASDRLVLGDHGTGPTLFVGGTGQGLLGYGIGGSGALTASQQLLWSDALTSASNGGSGIVKAWIVHSNTTLNLFPQSYAQDQIVTLGSVTIGSREFVLAADGGRNCVTSFSRDLATGQLAEVCSVGMLQGLGINAPTAMEVVQVNGQTFAVLAAAGSSSLSVIRLGADGSLEPTDHLIDNGSTRFASVQAITTVTAGNHAFVIAGGCDHGLTVFLLLPDGKLVWMETIADRAGMGLYNVSAIQAVVEGDTLHVFVGSQRDSGMTHFTLALGNLGVQLTGSTQTAQTVQGTGGDDILIAGSGGDTLQGGGGADILVAGPGATWMRGGAGADTFVMRSGSGITHVLDFERGIDRLDLTDWPMLRGVGQLTITSTATGARIDYRGYVIVVTAANGAPLTAQDMFPNGHLGPDRVPFIPANNTSPDPPDGGEDTVEPLPPPPSAPDPGHEIRGTREGETLTGGMGNDTIRGFGGDDLIYATGGDNLIFGGPGNDTIHGGPGSDTLRGGDGNDTIFGNNGNNFLYGDAGDDSIVGGSGNDRIWGGGGNDTINGGAGNDTLRGGAGDDLIFGGRGSDRIWGGAGNDTIYGEFGNNILRGGTGDDLIFGGIHNDRIFGGGGNDTIRGGDGNDTIVAGSGNDVLWGDAGADVFEFRRNHDTNQVMDFNPEEGDTLLLSRQLWRRFGALTPQQVVDQFGSVNGQGNTVLDFQSVGGTVVILMNFDDLSLLADHIQIL